MAHPQHLTLLAICLTSAIASGLRTTVIETFSGGFTGKILLPITSEVFGGWNLQLQFDEPIYDFQTWNANLKYISPDNRVLILDNMDWNTHILSGTSLEIDFIANIDVADSTTGTVDLKENDKISTAESSVGNSWWNGFTGSVSVPIPIEVQNGWVISARFTEYVPISVWSATEVYTSDNNDIHVLINKNYNGQLEDETTLDLDFNGYPNGQNGAIGLFDLYRRENGPRQSTDTYQCSNGTHLEVISTWTGNLHGKVITSLPSSDWTADLSFSLPVKSLQIWAVDIAVHDTKSRTFTLTSQERNHQHAHHLSAGAAHMYQFDFIVQFKGNNLPEFGFSFHNSITCNCDLAIDGCQGNSDESTTSIPPLSSTSETITESEVSVQTNGQDGAVPSNTEPSLSSTSETTTDEVSMQTNGQDGTVLSNTEQGNVDTTKDKTPSTQLTPTESLDSEPLVTSDQETQPDNAPLPTRFDYNDVLHKSILFYEAQRSGFLPADNRIPYRRDSAIYDAGEKGEDLTGGWYDAGDHIKLGFTMGQSVTVLAWGLLEFRSAYVQSGELQNVLSCIKWATDYFLKCHVKPNVFYALVGHPYEDHIDFGRPEDLLQAPRPSFKLDVTKPGSDVAGEVAAALAASSIAFRLEGEHQYADTLLDSARSLFQFGWDYRGLYSDSIPVIQEAYGSNSYYDELAWGAAWMYRATQEEEYLVMAEDIYSEYGIQDLAWAFSWSEKPAGVQLLLFQLTQKEKYESSIRRFLDFWLPEGGIAYTPGGLAWRSEWGSNCYAANSAFLATVAAKHGIRSERYMDFADKQIGFMLGDTGRSFVVGFGNNPPLQPHHSSSSCPTDVNEPCNWSNFNFDGPNPQILYGALVGGPSQNGYYVDVRSDYVHNEVTTSCNAGFQSAVAGLKYFSMTG